MCLIRKLIEKSFSWETMGYTENGKKLMRKQQGNKSKELKKGTKRKQLDLHKEAEESETEIPPPTPILQTRTIN
jgi:hypothetical protein